MNIGENITSTEQYSSIFVEHALQNETDRIKRRMALQKAYSASDPILLQHSLALCARELEFARTPNPTDIQYRRGLLKFTADIELLATEKFIPYSVHGTPYRNVPLIITDGVISSTAARNGIRTSYDTELTISTAPFSDIRICMDYVDRTRFAQPLGALFILDAKTEGGGMAPKQLHESLQFVVTGPEKIDEVSGLLYKSGYEDVQALEYYQFLDVMAKPQIQSIVTG
jgi:hypothetical protein